MRVEQKTPYTHFDKNNKFPVLVKFIRPTSVRFTHNKIYELTPCNLKQATNCQVTDDNGTSLTFCKGKDYWKLLSDERNQRLSELGI